MYDARDSQREMVIKFVVVDSVVDGVTGCHVLLFRNGTSVRPFGPPPEYPRTKFEDDQKCFFATLCQYPASCE